MLSSVPGLVENLSVGGGVRAMNKLREGSVRGLWIDRGANPCLIVVHGEADTD